jgi:GAF domain-containing protein
MAMFDHQLDAKGLSVLISDLLVATAEKADASIDKSVPEVLRLLRLQLGMDVVFVSEFVDGQRVFRFVDGSERNPGLAVGDSGPLEASYCQRVVEGRMPELVHDASALAKSLDLPKTDFRIGAHLSTPVVLPDGRVFGTVCCFSSATNPNLQENDLTNLRRCAQLVARKIDMAARRNIAPAEVDWQLVPMEDKKWRL